MKKYREPRITISKTDCNCNYCGNKIKKGNDVYVIPRKAVFHVKCFKHIKE